VAATFERQILTFLPRLSFGTVRSNDVAEFTMTRSHDNVGSASLFVVAFIIHPELLRLRQTCDNTTSNVDIIGSNTWTH